MPDLPPAQEKHQVNSGDRNFGTYMLVGECDLHVPGPCVIKQFRSVIYLSYARTGARRGYGGPTMIITKHKPVLLGLALAGLLLSTLVAAAPPAAAAVPTASVSNAATCGAGGPTYLNGKCISANWAGYLAIGYGPYNKVEAGWTQPSTPASAGGLYSATSIWIGIGGGKQGDAAPVQVGTLMTNGVFGRNIHGQPVYSAVYETPATGGEVTISGFTVKPGDSMYAEVSYQDSSFEMFLWDYTSGKGWSSGLIQTNYSRDTAEIIVEAPAYDNGNLFYDLAPFSNVKFTIATLGGAYALQMVRTNKNRTLVSMSAPSGCCSGTATYHYPN